MFQLFAVGGTMNINASINSVGSPIRFVSSPTSSVWPVAFGYFLATLLFGGVSGTCAQHLFRTYFLRSLKKCCQMQDHT